MATRPVFLPNYRGYSLFEERVFDFSWTSGYPDKNFEAKKKNIAALHTEAQKHGVSNILEISTKSSENVGKRLSAFNLKIKIGQNIYPLESVYQGSKVFENGGPFNKIFSFSPLDSKRFIQKQNLGNLIGFQLEENRYPLSPKTAFYDWIYIRSLADHSDWIFKNIKYQAFTDIEFNPAKQVNCQARAFAEYLSLQNRGVLQEAVGDFDMFSKMLEKQSQLSQFELKL